MRSLLVLLTLCGAAVGAAAKDKPPVLHRIPLPPRPDFSEVEWLKGDWAGKTTGKSPAGEISLSVTLDLGERYLVLRGEEKLAATPEIPEYRETWLGILTPDAAQMGFILRIFSDTGFMTRYRTTIDAGTVTFHPEGGEQPPPGWLFRRIIQRTDVGELLVTLQAAPPQKPFFDYYTAILKRKVSP
jgi:hypothetical protein